MGGSRFDPTDWKGYSSKTQTKTQQQIFTQTKTAHNLLDPKNIAVRESCDSEANPKSTPLIVGVDVTGSMGFLAENIVKVGLGVIMKEVYDRKPISDPHIMCMAIGDAFTDEAPLQVTQFEASIIITEQIEKIFIEAGGGGNGGESYLSAWYFAAMKTRADSVIKRQKKGYLFTVGDEPPHLTLTKSQIERIFGDTVERDYTAKELLDIASQSYEVFHLRVDPSHYSKKEWVHLLGERSIDVTDHTKLAEVIVSTMQVIEGADVDKVIGSWSGDTSLVVASAVRSLTKGAASTGVVRL